MTGLSVLAAAAVATTAALAFYPALALGRGVRLASLGVALMAILSSPLLASTRWMFGRFLAAVWAVALTVKILDVSHGAALGRRPVAWEYAVFLPNLSLVVWRKGRDEPRPAPDENRRRLGVWSIEAVAGMAFFALSYRIDWRHLPFALEHSAKVVSLYLALVPIAHAGAAVLRSLGLAVREPMDKPFAAVTPADFWKRYNRPAQQFFFEDVFKPLGGPRRPLRGTLATFAVSAALHEYLFEISSGRHRGYQLAFFLIQGLAVAATLRVRPIGGRAVTWWAATFLFNLVTSVLFFVCLNDVVRFYVPRSPGG